VDFVFLEGKKTETEKLMKVKPGIWLAVAILAFFGGLAAFIFLFVLHFNVYWLILAPVILAIYLSPAAYFYWLYKKSRRARIGSEKNSAPDGI
jgi:Ca2+/Na+ antiporter